MPCLRDWPLPRRRLKRRRDAVEMWIASLVRHLLLISELAVYDNWLFREAASDQTMSL